MSAPTTLDDPLKLRHPLRFPLMNTGASPARVLLFSTLLLIGIPLIWARARGAMFGDEALIAPINQYMPVTPLVLAAIAHYYRETRFLFDKLITRGVLSHPAGHEALVEALGRIGHELAGNWVGRIGSAAPYLVLVVTPVAVLANGVQSSHSGNWLFMKGGGIKPIAWYFVPVFHGVVMAMIAAWAFGHLRVARGLERVMRGEQGLRVQLRVPHPDSCMGLGPVAELVRHCVLILVTLSLLLFLWTGGATGTADFAARLRRLTEDDFAIPWTFYCLFSPILFFAPLAAARQTMWTAKQLSLATAGAEVMRTPLSSEPQPAEVLFTRIDAASVWPFTWRTLSSFASAVLLPLLLAIATELLMRLIRD